MVRLGLIGCGRIGRVHAGSIDVRPRVQLATHTEAAAPYRHFFLDRYTPAYRAGTGRFVTAVETGSVPSPGFADGQTALVLADAASESLRTRTTVKVAGA